MDFVQLLQQITRSPFDGILGIFGQYYDRDGHDDRFGFRGTFTDEHDADSAGPEATILRVGLRVFDDVGAGPDCPAPTDSGLDELDDAALAAVGGSVGPGADRCGEGYFNSAYECHGYS